MGLETGANTAAGGHHHHKSPPSESNHHHLLQTPKLLIIFAVVATSCLLLYHSSPPLRFPVHYNPFAATNHRANSESKLVELKTILKKAAISNNTVIITVINDAWAEPNSMFDQLLESFQIGNQTQRFLNHLVVVALDQKAYARCIKLHPHCYSLSTDGVDFSEEAYFMAADYLKMMWRRIDFLHTVLDLGYDFLFTVYMTKTCSIRSSSIPSFMTSIYKSGFLIRHSLVDFVSQAGISTRYAPCMPIVVLGWRTRFMISESCSKIGGNICCRLGMKPQRLALLLGLFLNLAEGHSKDLVPQRKKMDVEIRGDRLARGIL